MGSKNSEYAQKCLSSLNKFQESLDTNPNLSLSNDFRVSFKVLPRLLRKPEKYNILSHLFMAINGEADFYIASKPLLSKTKKYYSEIISTQDKDQSNLLHISTFQEIFETSIGLELRDIAYDSKKFDFYVADKGSSEWDKIALISPQKIGAEYFGYKAEKDLLKKNKTLKFYRLTEFGKRSANKRKIYKSLINNIEKHPMNHLEPFPNLEPSYIEFAKFDQVNWLYQRIDDLEVQVKPLIFLDSSLIFQLLLNFEANGRKFPSVFTEQILNQFEFVCLPVVLFDIEEAGYIEFVGEFLKRIINLPKLLEIEKFIVNYQDKLDEYGFSNLKIEILSDSVYWNFYVQFHVSVAKFLNADTILIVSNLKKHYLDKNCYNGKFSFFMEPEVKPTSLKCITAKKFWKKFKLEKQKAESDNLNDFVVSSNFKEWNVPECLGKILKELDRKLIKDVNTFWLDIFRISENPVENKKYFKEFVELINKFEDNANILKDVPQYSSLMDKDMHSRSNFSDIKDYTRKIKKFFQYLIEINRNRGFINSNELFLTVLLFKSNVSNFLRDRFYLKAKFKSPALPTTINFDLLYKDGNFQQEMSAIIPTRDRSNTLQKIIVKSKGKNKNSIRFEPNLHHNDEFINQLLRQFLFTNYFFHNSELETVYRDFIRFIKVKKEYRATAKGFSFNRFESLILNTQERSFILLEPHSIYYSKLLENFLLLIESYHRVHDTSLSLELSAKTLNIKEKELEILIYFLIQNGNMFREKSSPHPRYSLFFQAIKELNDKSTKLSKAKTYTPFWFPEKKNKILLSQAELWVESESNALDNTPIYYVDKENRVSYSDNAFKVEIKGETYLADVDTGAFKSLISKDIAERLFPKQKRYIVYVSGYTQHTKCVAMIKGVQFYYNGLVFTDDFLIEENLEKIFRTKVVIGRNGYNKMLTRYYGKTLENLFDVGVSRIFFKDPNNNSNESKARVYAIKGRIEKMREIAKSKGGKCLSTEYFTSRTKLKWECGECEQEFWASPEYVKNDNKWCPNCEGGKVILPSFYKFSRLRDIISLQIFKKIKIQNLITAKIVSGLENEILNNGVLSKLLSVKERKMVQKLFTTENERIIKYLSDLVEIIKFLLNIGLMYSKIRTPLTIKPIARSLYDKNITLAQSFKIFYNKSIIEIYDLLRDEDKDTFPRRSKTELNNTKNKSTLIGSRIKIYIIKNIYDGIYSGNGKEGCPECVKEGYKTYISRLKALEFHHTDEKERKHSATVLYELFNKNRVDPLFLDNLIESMESKKIRLLCANHHDLISSKYYNMFFHLISWKGLPSNFPPKIYSLSPELIHTLIKIAINNHLQTKDLSNKQKDYVKLSIIGLLKRKHIIETYHGTYCQTCGEFNTDEHLTSFHFNHIDKSKKTLIASELFKNNLLTCSEIAQILEREEGGYLCNNCHTVVHESGFYDLLDQVYEGDKIKEIVLTDHANTKRKFSLISNPDLINNHFILAKRLSDNFEKYLFNLSRLSKLNEEITNKILADSLGVGSRKIPADFFNRNDYMKQFVKIDRKNKITIYSLKNKGKEAIELIEYFTNYYSSL